MAVVDIRFEKHFVLPNPYGKYSLYIPRQKVVIALEAFVGFHSVLRVHPGAVDQVRENVGVHHIRPHFHVVLPFSLLSLVRALI